LLDQDDLKMNNLAHAVGNGLEGIRFRGQEFRAQKRFWHGTHRTVPPEETLERIMKHRKPVGLTRLADITGLDRIGIHTVLAHRPNCPTLANAAGKGYTLMAAKVSAAMEALEIYHAENLRLPQLVRTFEALVDEGISIPFESLPLTKNSMFHPHRAEYWALGWDIAGQREVAVPWVCVGMTPPEGQRPRRWMPFAIGTNGLAGGNHFLEALGAALYEVVERDAVACHRMAAGAGVHQMERVILDTIHSPLVRDLLDRLRAAGIKPAVYDCATDSDVPCYLAVIYDELLPNVGFYRGYGAHLDPAIAMVRAITEAVQARVITIAGSRDDFFRRDQLVNRFVSGKRGTDILESVPETVDARLRKDESTDSFEGDIHVVLGKLARVGLNQVIVLDLSHEEIGIPVTRVIVPGLEGYMFDHYRPGHRARAFIDQKGGQPAW
jgi:ribosomal protein S12 methylthiotransferase accessory factor